MSEFDRKSKIGLWVGVCGIRAWRLGAGWSTSTVVVAGAFMMIATVLSRSTTCEAKLEATTHFDVPSFSCLVSAPLWSTEWWAGSSGTAGRVSLLVEEVCGNRRHVSSDPWKHEGVVSLMCGDEVFLVVILTCEDHHSRFWILVSRCCSSTARGIFFPSFFCFRHIFICPRSLLLCSVISFVVVRTSFFLIFAFVVLSVICHIFL